MILSGPSILKILNRRKSRGDLFKYIIILEIFLVNYSCSLTWGTTGLAWWLGLMAPNEEVVGSIPHVGVVLTALVHPTMVGVLGPCCMGTSKPFALEEILSIPTMVLMTSCPKQLIKRLWRLPNSHCVTWPTCESLLSHLHDLWWTLLKTIQHTYFLSTIYHPLHPFVYDVDRISWLGYLLVIIWLWFNDYVYTIT